MIKFLKWFFIIIVAVFVLGLLALFIFIRNFDANRYKSQITASLSKSLHHPVQLKEIQLDFSFEKGLNLNVTGFEILEQPPSDEIIVSVDQALFGVDINAFMTHREVLITRIELEKPFIRVVRYADQTTNIQKFIDEPKKEVSPMESIKEKPSAKKDIDFSKIKIRLVRITNGHLILVGDESERIEIDHLNLTIENLTFNKPFTFDLNLNIFADEPNIFVKGEAFLDKDAKTVRLRNLQGKTSLDSFDMKKLIAHIKALEQFGIEEQLKGELALNINELNASDQGLLQYDFEGKLIDGRLKVKSLRYPIEHIGMILIGKDPDVKLKDVFMYIGGGKISADAVIRQFLKDNRFEGALSLDAILLEELIPQESSEYKLIGKLFGKADIKGEHNALISYDQSLAGQASVELKEGKILNLNVLKVVLDKLEFLPSVAESLHSRLPQHYKDKLKENNTTISKCIFLSTIKEDNVFIKEVTLEGDGFIINARGKMDLQQNIYLEADFYMAADLATSLLASSDDVSFLLQEDGRLHIPFKPYRGPIDKIRMFPDIENISKAAIKSKGKQELRKAIFKALDLEDAKSQGADPEASPTETPPTQKPTKNEARPEEILIENVLDAIFQ